VAGKAERYSRGVYPIVIDDAAAPLANVHLTDAEFLFVFYAAQNYP
jgi:hypothetical protein